MTRRKPRLFDGMDLEGIRFRATIGDCFAVAVIAIVIVGFVLLTVIFGGGE